MIKLVKTLTETHKVAKHINTIGGWTYSAFSPMIDNAGRLTAEGEYQTGIPAGTVVNREDAAKSQAMASLLGRDVATEV